VRQAMQQLVAEMTRPVVMSDRASRGLAQVRDARHEHLQAHGHDPSTGELARATGLGRQQVDRLVAAERVPQALDAPLARGETSGETLGNQLADPTAEDAYDRLDRVLEIDRLRGLPGPLSDRERDVVRAHYGLGRPTQTLREIAVGLRVSVERVRQIEEKALGKLRDEIL
jgi:RNA polymerase primary sigma factor